MKDRFLALCAFVVIAICIYVVSAAEAAQPPSPSYSAQWSRTSVTRPQPAGMGCVDYTPTGTTATVLLGPNMLRGVYSLPLQLKLINTATASMTVCASQDPTPGFDRSGYFRVDSEGVYLAGRGICTTVPAGSIDYMGVFSDSFDKQPTTYPPGGGRLGKCVTSGAPCRHSGECQGTVTTCTANTRAETTHIVVVAPGGSGIGSMEVCEVQ